MTPGTHIDTFMKKAQHAHCVVIFLNEAYLKSRNCLFELMQVWDSANKRLRANTFVIRHPEADISGQGSNHVAYTEHWQGLCAELEQAKGNAAPILSPYNCPLVC